MGRCWSVVTQENAWKTSAGDLDQLREMSMSEASQQTKSTPLIAFFMASGDMVYNEVAEREVYLRQEAVLGPILRGEMPGCGPGCYADLSQVFLEYAMSCEGCRDQDAAGEWVSRFGEKLGVALAANLSEDLGGLPEDERVLQAFECVVRSLGVPFQVHKTDDKLEFTLSNCPLCATGSKTGLARDMALARRGFASLCIALLGALAPDWRLLKPEIPESSETLLEIHLASSG